MPEKKPLVILSLGQLLGTNLDASVKAFADIVEQKRAQWLGGFFSAASSVQWALFLDSIWYGTIDKYKKGEIEFKDFRSALNSQLGINIEETEFKNAWNAMCKVSDQEVTNINNILRFQEEKGFDLCVVSATNQSQCDYIKSQLSEKEIDIPIVTSYENRTLDLQNLAKSALENTYKNGNKVISLHKAIKDPAKLKVAPGDLSVRPFDSRKENIIVVLKGLLPPTKAKVTEPDAKVDEPAAAQSEVLKGSWVENERKRSDAAESKGSEMSVG